MEWKPSRDVGLLLGGPLRRRGAARQHRQPRLPHAVFFNLDLQASLSLARWVKRGEPRIRVQATNLLDDDRHWPSGYSYLYFVRDGAGQDALGGTPYYFPLATRSVYVTLDLGF